MTVPDIFEGFRFSLCLKPNANEGVISFEIQRK